jgi:hypothetical protein
MAAAVFPRLEDETRPLLDTAAAAYYLGRRPQTLRIWALGRVSAPVLPRRIGGRLGWPTDEIRRLCGVSA